MRKRADIVLVERGFLSSRARAQAAIAAGLVRVGGVTLRKPSEEIADDAEITAKAPHPWASRGGIKLTAALDAFALDPAGLVCLDVGASTGGFTDVLLARGAARVVAVDVGHGQLDPRLAAMIASSRSKASTPARSHASASALPPARSSATSASSRSASSCRMCWSWRLHPRGWSASSSRNSRPAGPRS